MTLHTTTVAIATALLLSGCATDSGTEVATIKTAKTATEGIRLQNTFVPNVAVNYRQNSRMDFSIIPTGKTDSVTQVMTSNSQLSVKTSKKNKDGSIAMTIAVKANKTVVDGKVQSVPLPENIVLKQKVNGELISMSGDTAGDITALLDIAGQFNFPKQMAVGKTYPIKIDDETIRTFFADMRTPSLVFDSNGRVKIDKADENYAWGQMQNAFSAKSKNAGKPFTLSGSQTMRFTYNRKTHLFSEVKDTMKYTATTPNFSMKFLNQNSLIQRK